MLGFHGTHGAGLSDRATGRPKMKTVGREFDYLKRYPAIALAMLTCATVSTLMATVFPLVTKQALDVVIRQNHPEQLIPLTLLAVLAALLQNGLNSLRLRFHNTFRQRVIFDLRSAL